MLSGRLSAILLYLFFAVPACAQVLKGHITDNSGLPVPFAVVYDETTFSGTTSNTEGNYEIRLTPGSHTVVYKAMGYYQVRQTIIIDVQPVEVNVRLKEQPVAVKEVVIRPGKEDPAYAIMRKVIGLAPYHLNQVKQYNADVYLRGTANIIRIPKFISKRTTINGEKNAIRSGDVYLEESVNQVQFNAPDHYEQKVISIRSTFPWNNGDVNPMGLINSSLYEPEIEDFISPLAPNAFQFYTYKYLGFFEEGKQVIFKIQVLPKRNSQQLMRGTIFIVDQLWCLHSADVSVNMFFGSINFKTIYSAVKKDAWLPVSHQFYINAAIMGVRADFKYNSSVKFNQVVLNEKREAVRAIAVPAPKDKSAEEDIAGGKKTKNQQNLENLLSKEDLTNRDMMKLANALAKEAKGDTIENKSLEIKDEGSSNKVIVEKDAVRNDTAYWNTVRPIPLTAIESKIHTLSSAKPGVGKDSITISTRSVDKKETGWSKVAGFITNGAGFHVFDSTLFVKYEGMIGFKKIDFNTVDGLIYRQTFFLEQKIDSAHKLSIRPGVAYAFSRERFMWWCTLQYDYAPMRGGSFQLYAGSESADYNSESGISSTYNSMATLIFRRNYMKLYQRNQVQVSNKIELASGLNLAVLLGYRTAQPLRNHNDYSFFYRDERYFTPNIPRGGEDRLARNIYNEEAYWDIGLEYTPRYFYKVSGGRKHYQHSKYPTLFVHNKMAVPGIIKSTADYDLLEAGMKQEITWGMMHAFSWNFKAGFFLNRNLIFSMDDKYFNSLDVPLVFDNDKDAYRVLPIYMYGTTRNFAEAHIQFTTPYLLFKYLPFLSNKIWVENLHFNYLTTADQHHYWEAGYSMGQIYMAGSIGIYAGFINSEFQSLGIQVAIDFE